MKTPKTLKLMFKALDLKDSREITKVIHCHNDKDIVTMVATNGHIMLKTEVHQTDLEFVVGPLPLNPYFSIKPDKIKTAVCVDSTTYFNTVLRVVPDIELLERQYSWVAFDPDYLVLATDFLTHEYGAKYRAIKPLVLSTGNTTAPHMFGDLSTGSWALIMPLKLELTNEA